MRILWTNLVVRTFRTPRSNLAGRRPAALLVRIAAVKEGGVIDGMVYIERGAHQTCHAIATLYSREPLALDLARVLLEGKATRLLQENVATALVAIAAESGRRRARPPRCRP